jgi:hypothetical protein
MPPSGHCLRPDRRRAWVDSGPSPGRVQVARLRRNRPFGFSTYTLNPLVSGGSGPAALQAAFRTGHADSHRDQVTTDSVN